LVAALNPPVQRHLILSKVDESVEIGSKPYSLYSFKTSDFVMQGYRHQQRFVLDHLPTFVYSVEDVFFEKTVCMVQGDNTVCILYHVINGSSSMKLRLAPLVNFRDYHHTSRKQHMRFSRALQEKTVFIKPYGLELDIRLSCSDGVFIGQDDCWFYGMDYPVERERGLDSTEDHYIPGYFEITLEPFERKYVTLIATVEKDKIYGDGLSIIKMENERIDSMLAKSGYGDKLALALVKAADAFIVQRKSTNSKTVIAGYPWFTDWGRDTMIAFTGLTLVTKRFEDAKDILYTFSRYVKYGLLPNMFPDAGEEPPYNSVDAALWYFEAVAAYLRYTGDHSFIKQYIYPALKAIILAYINGTLYNIKMDADCLISSGSAETQLTWMDVKVGDWVVTPRHGKAVEINALWYNALRILQSLSDGYGEDGLYYKEIADCSKEAFIREFWYEEGKCLYDVVNSDGKDRAVRPNQILAVSLSNPVIAGEKARYVVQTVWKHLYAGYGLRTLSPEFPGYSGRYAGDQYHRDGAYHQGTVWTWPLGHFITAFMKAFGYSDENRKTALRFIKPIRDHLYDGCLGSVSEIFDGDSPRLPRGCFAQAWSVAEALRAYVEDIGAENV
jgi:predicted glycogen debranching enzyme